MALFLRKRLRRNSKCVLFVLVLVVGAAAVYHQMVAVKLWNVVPISSREVNSWRRQLSNEGEQPGAKEDSATRKFSASLQTWSSENQGRANLHVFEDWCGSSVNSLRKNTHFPLHPHTKITVKKLAVSPQWTNYGLRIFGYLHPHTDGEFVFAVSSDDNSEFWLSSGDSPLDVRLLAWVGKTGAEWAAPGEFLKYASQTSRPVRLSAQKRYFFEVLHKQDDKGTDHVEIAWKSLNSSTGFSVIDSSHISLYVDESSLLLNDHAHIPQTAASRQNQSTEGQSDAVDMKRGDPRDSFYKVPLINSSLLRGVLPDCVYKPTNTIKGLSLRRYEGLQYVHLSYVYPNDYTRLTHMENQDSCIYNRNRRHMIGFSQYMKLDRGNPSKNSARDSRLSWSDMIRRKEQSKEDQMHRAPSQDYADDYGVYVHSRRRKLFSLVQREPKKVPRLMATNPVEHPLSVTSKNVLKNEEKERRMESEVALLKKQEQVNAEIQDGGQGKAKSIIPSKRLGAKAGQRHRAAKKKLKGSKVQLRKNGAFAKHNYDNNNKVTEPKPVMVSARKVTDRPPVEPSQKKTRDQKVEMNMTLLQNTVQSKTTMMGTLEGRTDGKQSGEKVEVLPTQPEKIQPNQQEKKFQANQQEKEFRPSQEEKKLQQNQQEKEFRPNQEEKELQQKQQEEEVQANQEEKKFQANQQEKKFQANKQEKKFQQNQQEKKFQQNQQEKNFQEKEVQQKQQEKKIQPNQKEKKLQQKQQEEELQQKQQEEELQQKQQEEELQQKQQEEELQQKQQEEELQQKQQEKEFQPNQQEKEFQPNQQEKKFQQKLQEEELQQKQQEEELQPNQVDYYYIPKEEIPETTDKPKEASVEWNKPLVGKKNTAAPVFVKEVNWNQTFQFNPLDLQEQRSDRNDVTCTLLGNLLLDTKDALLLVQAFRAELDKKHPGLSLVRVVNVEKSVDGTKGSRYFLELEMKDGSGRLLRLSHYIYALRSQSGFQRWHLGDPHAQSKELLCNPVGFKWDPGATVHIIVPVKNQGRWVRHLISQMEELFQDTGDANFNLIVTDYSSTDIDVKKTLQGSAIKRYQYLRLSGPFQRSAGLQAGVDLVKDQHSIVFLCDLHLDFPHSIIDSIRKHTVEGHAVFAPIVMRLDCGSTPQEARGFWEVNGFGLLGIYKSDLDAIGGMNTQEFTNTWGGEDWELMDRILQGGLEVERLYLRNFFHYFHSKRGMWNNLMVSRQR